jgi:peptide/nickel transport system permease protein
MNPIGAVEQTLARSDAVVRRRWKPSLSAWTGIGIVGFWIFLALVGSQLAPFQESDFVSDDIFVKPCKSFLLGTDYVGRDILSRLLHGTRLTLGMAILATLIASAVGSMVGILSAIKGGWVDMVISRIDDALLSVPGIMMALVVVAAVGSSITTLICTTGLIYACSVFRIARALGMDIIVLDYVEVARARGESIWWILIWEILPNAAVPLMVDFGIRLSFAIRFMSSLSFLGLGVQPPFADWGGMVRENLIGLSAKSFAPIIPAIAIASLTIGLNLIVDDYIARSGQEVAKRVT